MQIQSVPILWPLVMYVFVFLLIALSLGLRRFYKNTLNISVLKKMQTYLYILAAFLLLFIANLIIFDRPLSSTFNLLTSSASKTVMLNHFELTAFIIVLTVIGPVFEEVVFRAPLFLWINKSVYFYGALIVSSILFGLIHTGYPLFGFIMGIVFGVVFKLSKSIVPAVMIHMLWNVFSIFYYNVI